jgi:hypothetical protein
MRTACRTRPVEKAARSLKTETGQGQNLGGGGALEGEKCRLPFVRSIAEYSEGQVLHRSKSMGGYARAGEEIPREVNARKGTTAAPLKQRGGPNGLPGERIPAAAARGRIRNARGKRQAAGGERVAKAKPVFREGNPLKVESLRSALRLNRWRRHGREKTL